MAAEGRKISLADKTGGRVWSQANIREQSEFHDVSLISNDGEKFLAHRVILAVSSSYLESKMKKNSQHDITFKKVNSQVLAALIDFIYDGEAVISEAEAETFINTAKKRKIRQFLSVRRMKTPVKSVESPSNGTTPYPAHSGALSQSPPQVQRYSCSYYDKTFPSRKKAMQHLKRKT